MSVYLRAQDTALRMLKQFGTEVKIIRAIEGDYDPVTGDSMPGGTQEFETVGILADYSLKESGLINLSGAVIQQQDKKITIAAKPLETSPMLTDQLQILGTRYTIANIKAVSPAGETIIYEIQGKS
ncbi:hypothetical protein [Photobacterium sp. 1_MG-2023]|uniref:hypothetical protein n=1 Tax=Photobacterium sp. 1_MG-2023 TaxID=3062646 RepID=UPI0026E26D33|nr:hypothetical protein [Photobacterium sp. 1_MG-2023]MDO6706787.1 hypothetical protein [Photobacterium sp. 1_MG-2023]